MARMASGDWIAASAVSPHMASGPPAWIQAGDRVPNDHGVRVHEHLADHESDDLLTFTNRGVRGGLAQSGEEALEGLGQLQARLLIDQLAVKGFHLAAEALLPFAEIGHAPAEFVQ